MTMAQAISLDTFNKKTFIRRNESEEITESKHKWCNKKIAQLHYS